MAFNGNNMTPIGGNARAGENDLDRNAPMGWAYQSKTDALSTVLGTGYFDTFHLFLAAGQFIYTSLTDQKVFITIQSVDHVLKQVVVDPEIIGGSGGSGSGAFPVEVFTDTVKVLDLADNLRFFVMDNAAAQTVIIPENDDKAFPVGAEIDFIREGAGAVSFIVSGVAILNSKDGLFAIATQYAAVSLKKIDTDEWRLIGDLVLG